MTDAFPNALFRNHFPEGDPAEFVSGVFSDELDRIGLKHQVAAGFVQNMPGLRCFGRARTIALETVETDDENIRTGLGFLAELEPGDVLVVQGSPEFAYFGELMSRLSMRARLAGVVIDGLTRDLFFTRTIDLPIFARGYTPVDIKGRGRVRTVDMPIEIGGIAVAPGDFIFADPDAVVCLPQGAMARLQPRIAAAIADETRIKKMIADEMSVTEMLTQITGF